MKYKKTLLTVLIVAALAAGFLIGRFSVGSPDGQTEIESRQTNTGYHFINPLLECDLAKPTFFRNIHGIEDEVDNIINQAKTDHRISFASAYFRDLTNGPWFGINEEKQFVPASLSKVPIMIAYLKQVEKDPSLPEKTVPFNKARKYEFQRYIPIETMEPGKSYTTQELLKRMIIYSDNDAMYTLLLSKLIDVSMFDTTYSDLGIKPPSLASSTIDVHTYASFFRILYNATYLPRPLSEFALGLLSESTFKEGIRKGVPENILMAHKFGENTDQFSGEKQLHDCGIVYFPGRPYVLCVMTRGNDFDQISSVIAGISEAVYEGIKKQR